MGLGLEVLLLPFHISRSIGAGDEERSALPFSATQAVGFDAVVCRSILAGAEIVAQPNLLFTSVGHSPR